MKQAYLNDISDCHEWWAILASAKGDVMYDIGANGGLTAEMFAKSFNCVYAFEPAEESFPHLLETAQLHTNIMPFDRAVSDKKGPLTLRVCDSIDTGQLVTPTPATVEGWGTTRGFREVPAITVDDTAFATGMSPPTHMKIDVEGHEGHVLRGASRTLQENHPTIYLEIHSPELGEECTKLLHDAGYKNLEVHRHTGYTPNSENWFIHYYLLAK